MLKAKPAAASRRRRRSSRSDPAALTTPPPLPVPPYIELGVMTSTLLRGGSCVCVDLLRSIRRRGLIFVGGIDRPKSPSRGKINQMHQSNEAHRFVRVPACARLSGVVSPCFTRMRESSLACLVEPEIANSEFCRVTSTRDPGARGASFCAKTSEGRSEPNAERELRKEEVRDVQPSPNRFRRCDARIDASSAAWPSLSTN
jgi:hypothetical protein